MRTKIAAEAQNISETLGILREALGRKQRSVIELAALAAFLQNIYNGIENILKMILKAKRIAIPSGATWHRDLLELSVAEKFLSRELADELHEYRAFRHVFTHSYSLMLEEVQLIPLVSNISGVYGRFISEIDAALVSLSPE